MVPTAQTTSIRLFFAGLILIFRRIFQDYGHTTRFFLMDQPLTHFKVPSVEIGLQHRGCMHTSACTSSYKALQHAQLSEAISSSVFL